MSSYVLRRMLVLLPLLLGVTLFAFLLISSAPGDPVSAMINPVDTSIDISSLQARREALGLNDTLPVRYLRWLRELLSGNLGMSYATGRPVLDELMGRIGATMQLAGAALLVALGVGVVSGVLAALRQNSWIDNSVTVAAFAAVATPPFFLGLALIYLLSLKLGVLPTGGMISLGTAGGLKDRLLHLVMPAVVLALPLIAETMRYTRGSLLEVLHQDFVRTARSKGLPERRVTFRHALRNALLPLITVTALALPTLLGGAILTETVFQWPGVGTLTIDAVHQRDYPIILAVTLFSALCVILANLLADFTYALVDPRIRYDA